MGWKDLLEEQATRLGEGARAAASVQAQRAGEGFRGLRAIFEDDEESLSVERFLHLLVRAVRDDEGESTDRSSRDVYVIARKRRRRLGLISFATGPLVGVANQVADLYCETATVCDVAALHEMNLDDGQIAAHMLVLWSVTDDLGEAQRAIASEISLADLLGGKLFVQVDERLPEELTKRSIASALWDIRETVGDVRRGATSEAVRTVAFTGHRTKKVIGRAEAQLGVEQAAAGRWAAKLRRPPL